MRISGFTIVRNAITYDYPIIESIQSALPLVDEMIVSVGKSEDDTLQLIQSIASNKIKIKESTWDDSLREGGKVLAVETQKAFEQISAESDWAIYLQGDEVLHEKDYTIIKEQMKNCLHNTEVDGLLFDYKHFFGSYDYIGSSEQWYAHEIRVIRNNKNIYSFKDAQGFRKKGNNKLKVKKANASIYHYGWVKNPKDMKKKNDDFQKLWHKTNDLNQSEEVEYDYNEKAQALKKFNDTHPATMLERIRNRNWDWEYNKKAFKPSLKTKLKRAAKKIGLDFSYKNYELISD